MVPRHTMFNLSPHADSHIADSLIQFPVRSRASCFVVADLLSASMSLFSDLQKQWQYHQLVRTLTRPLATFKAIITIWSVCFNSNTKTIVNWWFPWIAYQLWSTYLEKVHEKNYFPWNRVFPLFQGCWFQFILFFSHRDFLNSSLKCY